MPWVFFPAVLRERVILGLKVGVVTAAAVTGVLLGLGRAHGATFRPVNAVAHVVIGSRALFFDRFYPSVTLLGVVILVVAMLVWGVIFALVATRARGGKLVLLAVALTLFIYLMNAGVLPPRLRPGFELMLSTAELAAVYIATALSLACALTWSRRGRDRA